VSGAVPALIAAAAGVGLGHAILPDHWVPLAVVGRTQRYPLARVARLSALAGIAHVLVSLVLGAIIIVVGLQFRSAVQSAQNAIIGIVLILTGIAFAALELSGRGHGHSHEDGHSHLHEDGHGHGHEDGHGHGHGRNHEHEHQHEHERAHTDRREPQRSRGHGPTLALTPTQLPAGSAADRDLSAVHAKSRARGLAAIMVPFGAAASPDLTILPVFLAATAAGLFAAIGALVVFSAVTIVTIVGLTLFACSGGYRVQGQWLDRWGNMFTAGVLLVIGALVLTSII
jgi:nickel/cobalt exporter